MKTLDGLANSWNKVGGWSTSKPIIIHPIGTVRNIITSKNKSAGLTIESRLVIQKRYTKALKGLREYSHLIILFYLHEASENPIEILVKPGNRSHLPRIGIFSTRNTAHRPNKIGLSIVRLLGMRSNIIKVVGLDAFNGSPIIDIKPLMRWDLAGETTIERKILDGSMKLKFTGTIRVPEWWRKF